MNLKKKRISKLVSIAIGCLLVLGAILTLKQTIFANPGRATHIVISEVWYADSSGGSTSQFVELYNPTNSSKDISGWTLKSDGTDADATIPASTSIAAHGYYLIGEAGYDSIAPGNGWPLADFQETLNLSVASDGSTLLDGAFPGANIIDAIGWGVAGSIDPEGYETTPFADVANGHSIERKAISTSDATKLASGGTDETKGNSEDTDDNSNDCVDQASPNPQNSSSTSREDPVTQLGYQTAAQELAVNEVSGPYSVWSLDEGGYSCPLFTGPATINLSSDSDSELFDTSAGGAFDGSILSITIASGVYEGVFYYKEPTTAGTYSVLSAVESPGTYSRYWTEVKQTVTITSGGNTAPVVSISSVAQRTDGSGHIEINFTGTDADNNNCNWVDADCEYAIGPAYDTWTDITFDTADGAHTADEPMAFTSAGASFVAVVDASGWSDGNYQVRLKVNDGTDDSAQETSSAFAVDNTAPTMDSAITGDSASGSSTATTKILVTFSEDLDGTTVASTDFTVASNTVSAASETAAGKVTLTLGTAIATDATPVVTLVDGQSVSNVAGYAVTGDGTSTYDKTPSDGLSPTMDSAITGAAAGDSTATTTILVTFSEDLDGTTVAAGDFTVASNTVSAADETSAGVVTLTLGTALATDATPDVTLGDTGVEDVAAGGHNTLASAGPITPVDGLAPVPSAVSSSLPLSGGNLQDGTVLTITFSEAVTYTAAVDGDFEVDPDGSGVAAATTLTGDGVTSVTYEDDGTPGDAVIIATLTGATTSGNWTTSATFNRDALSMNTSDGIDDVMDYEAQANSTAPTISGLVTAGEVVISELFCEETGVDTHTFVELYNTTSAAVTLTGWTMEEWDADGTASTPHMTYSFTAGESIPAHGYYVIGQADPLDSDDFGGLSISPDDVDTFPTDIYNANSLVVLKDDTGTYMDGMGHGTCTNSNMPQTDLPGHSDVGEGNSLEREPGCPLGNATDTDDNSADCNAQTTPNPQNSSCPVVSSVSPTSGSASSTTDITVNGTMFVSLPEVSLWAIATVTLVTDCTAEAFVNATQVTATVPSGVATGTYRVVVKNPATASQQNSPLTEFEVNGGAAETKISITNWRELY